MKWKIFLLGESNNPRLPFRDNTVARVFQGPQYTYRYSKPAGVSLCYTSGVQAARFFRVIAKRELRGVFMKANKALKRLAKIEALMSNVAARYSASEPHTQEVLQEAKAAVARARETVQASSGTAKNPAKPKRKLSAAPRRRAQKRAAAAKAGRAAKKAAPARKKAAVKKAAVKTPIANAAKKSAPIKRAAKKTAAKKMPPVSVPAPKEAATQSRVPAPGMERVPTSYRA